MAREYSLRKAEKYPEALKTKKWSMNGKNADPVLQKRKSMQFKNAFEYFLNIKTYKIYDIIFVYSGERKKSFGNMANLRTKLLPSKRHL